MKVTEFFHKLHSKNLQISYLAILHHGSLLFCEILREVVSKGWKGLKAYYASAINSHFTVEVSFFFECPPGPHIYMFQTLTYMIYIIGQQL